MRGTREQRQFWETGNIGNLFFFGEQGNKAIYFSETREQDINIIVILQKASSYYIRIKYENQVSRC